MSHGERIFIFWLRSEVVVVVVVVVVVRIFSLNVCRLHSWIHIGRSAVVPVYGRVLMLQLSMRPLRRCSFVR
jgi:hypothetical protein